VGHNSDPGILKYFLALRAAAPRGPRHRDLIPEVRGRHDADHAGDEVEKAGPVGAVRARGPTRKEGRSEVERDSARKTADDGAGGLRQPKPAKDAPQVCIPG
jgi:hypothetical protein